MGKTKQLFEQMQSEFLETSHNVEEGNITELDAFIDFKQNMNLLESSSKMFKEWIGENIDNIFSQAKELPEGRGKYLFETKNGKRTFNFDNCPTIVKLKKELKAEEKSYKLAYENSLLGRMQADENGEEIYLPSCKTSNPAVNLKLKKDD